MKRIRTKSDFIEKCFNKFESKYDYSESNYINAKEKITIKCNLHNIYFPQWPGNHLSGRLGCIECRRSKREVFIKKRADEFIQKSIQIFGENIFDYSFVVFNQLTNIIIKLKCINHNMLFKQFTDKHLKGHYGCKECKNKNKQNRILQAKDNFIKDCNIIHNNKFDYSEVIYKNKIHPVKITCIIHGFFYQRPDTHKRGFVGCKECSKIKQCDDINDFLNKSKLAHDNKYNYKLVNYIGRNKKIKIICKIHGIFKTTPKNHTNRKTGCPKCAIDSRRLSLEVFIEKAKKIHNDKFEYNEVNYINCSTKVKLRCKIKNHIIWQSPDSHLSGNGCSKCSNNISKSETQWLNSLFIPNDKKHRNVHIKIKNNRFNVDGYNPDINTIYEFYGDFWHGNPAVYRPHDVNKINKKTFGELYKNTIYREKLLKNAGFDIISIWENEFDKNIKKESYE